MGTQLVTTAPASGSSGHCLPGHSGSLWDRPWPSRSIALQDFSLRTASKNPTQSYLQGRLDVAAFRPLSMDLLWGCPGYLSSPKEILLFSETWGKALKHI